MNWSITSSKFTWTVFIIPDLLTYDKSLPHRDENGDLFREVATEGGVDAVVA